MVFDENGGQSRGGLEVGESLSLVGKHLCDTVMGSSTVNDLIDVKMVISSYILIYFESPSLSHFRKCLDL